MVYGRTTTIDAEMLSSASRWTAEERGTSAT